ncbi:ABC transporter ATP-binding protein [Grimontia sp. NTOU-MAR1]|uniref:ABC transporter ATP-binding protein n=1 Tax=Grimontia sp. NTOU-MAR1 TaxID=3111011 RepID=UPI002DB5D245|nr:ABC transporter ATP-binding protein [Grimontia sp. NTOU-MAR1]WRV98370.1 ABC transporter ATP-binding protein [Grimontia sp. NTOU-MAR1]
MTLEVKSGYFGHSPSQPIVSDLNFFLQPGEIMAILGPNGVGKTTLINAVMGIHRWQEGETLVRERPITQFTPRELWKELGYVPQARTNAFAYSVMDMILLGRSTHLGIFDRPGIKDKDAARQVMERLEIGHLEHCFCNAISGGELQLVFIARALLAQPSILFLDEPESHLDFKKQLIILGIIEKLAREDNIICVLNTHFPNHALRIAHKVLLMDADRNHHFGTVEDILTEQAIQDCFGVKAVMSDISLGDRTHRAIHPISLVDSIYSDKNI